MNRRVTAHLRFLRIAPRKVRLVLDLVRGRSLEMAEQQLMVLPKASSQPILKLLKSAQANAEHNFKLDPKSLVIAQAYVNEGPKLKRFMPHAMGRATVILKRMSHVTVVLAAKGQTAGAGTVPTKPGAVSVPAKPLASFRLSGSKQTSKPAVATKAKSIKEKH